MDAPWILYVARDLRDASIFCPGSRQAIAAYEALENPDVVLVQSVEVLLQRQVALPGWLTGTPTLVHADAKTVYRGSRAVEQLRKLEAGASEPAPGPRATELRSFGDDDEEPTLALPAVQNVDASRVRDGKITEEDLQAFITERNRMLPETHAAPPQSSG